MFSCCKSLHRLQPGNWIFGQCEGERAVVFNRAAFAGPYSRVVDPVLYVHQSDFRCRIGTDLDYTVGRRASKNVDKIETETVTSADDFDICSELG